MSLVRGLTKRMRLQQDDSAWLHKDPSPNRSFSTKRQDKPFDRTKISLPVELLSSSNALAYDAPNLSTLTPNVDVGLSCITMASESPKAEQRSGYEAISSPVSSASSTKSYTESVTSPGMSSASSVSSHGDSREGSPTLAEHAHLKPFFFNDKETRAPTGTASHRETTHSTASSSLPRQSNGSATLAPENDGIPSIPQRALSHTKRSHQFLARHRSASRLSGERPAADLPHMKSADASAAAPDLSSGGHLSYSSMAHSHLSFAKSTQSHSSIATSRVSVDSTGPTLPLAPSTPTVIPSSPMKPATRSSLDSFGVKPAADHPFGAELAQVNELAEEYGVDDVEILDEESRWLIDNGFMRYAAEDYILEIQPLVGRVFDAAGAGWL